MSVPSMERAEIAQEVIMLEHRALFAAFCAAALCAPLTVKAQDDEPFDRSPEACITVSRIDKTDIVDDQTIIFFMRGKRIYRNYLPQRCPRLEAEDRFGYRVTTARVCKSDTLVVLPLVGLPTYCRLGEFQPITAEEAEELRAISEGRPIDGIDAQPVEPADEAPATGRAGQEPDGEERREGAEPDGAEPPP